MALARGEEGNEEGIAAHSGIVFSEVEKFRQQQAKVRDPACWAPLDPVP